MNYSCMGEARRMSGVWSFYTGWWLWWNGEEPLRMLYSVGGAVVWS